MCYPTLSNHQLAERHFTLTAKDVLEARPSNINLCTYNMLDLFCRLWGYTVGKTKGMPLCSFSLGVSKGKEDTHTKYTHCVVIGR